MIRNLLRLMMGGLALMAVIAGGTSAAHEQTVTPPIYLPLVMTSADTTFISPTDSPLAAPIPRSGVALDFPQIARELNDDGLELAYNKIGFHMGIGGNARGIEDWINQLDAAGVPLFLKSADDAGLIYLVQEKMKESGVPHTLVFRRTGLGYDLPNYDAEPEAAAEAHWVRHLETFPPELEKEYVWLETINEVDKARSAWLGRFALRTAELAVRDGYKWLAFGWSSGEPEQVDWESPEMLAFLRFAAEHPDQIGVALHEYSYIRGDIGNQYPYLNGRFQLLFEICDTHQINRPTVMITEWGWEYQDIPDVENAMADIAWAARLYAAYPEVKGAAIWYLGGNFGDIHNQTQQLIAPVTTYSLQNYFEIEQGKGKIDPSLFAP